MALFEMWLERSSDMKYIPCFERVTTETDKNKFIGSPVDTPYVAISIIRQEIRKVMGASDQIRIKNRIKVYDNYSFNDALEDLTRS